MINATTEKNFSNWRYITLKLMLADDPLMMYYIKKNYTTFTDIDTGKLKRSLKYKQFLKSSKSKSITDFDDVTIIDDKNHSTGKAGNVVFVDDGNRKRVVLNFIDKKASSTSSASKAKKPSTKMTATQRRDLAMKKLEDEEDTFDETASRVFERIKSEAIGGANPPPPRNNESNRQANPPPTPPRNDEEFVRANLAPYSRGYQPRQSLFEFLVEQPETKKTRLNAAEETRLNAAEEKSENQWDRFYNLERELSRANNKGTSDDNIDNNDTITYRGYLEEQLFKNIYKFLIENIWQLTDKTIPMKDAHFRIYDYELVVDILNLDDEIKHLDDLDDVTFEYNTENQDPYQSDDIEPSQTENIEPSQTGGLYCYNNPTDRDYNETLEYNQKSDEKNKKRIVADIYHDFSSKFVREEKYKLENFMNEFQKTINDDSMIKGEIENNYVGLHEEYLKRHSESFWIVFPTLMDIDLQRIFGVRPVMDTGIHRPLYQTIFDKVPERTAATFIDPITQESSQTKTNEKLALIANGDNFFNIPLDVINDLSKKFYTSSFNGHFEGYYVEFYVLKTAVLKTVLKNGALKKAVLKKGVPTNQKSVNNHYQLQYRISNYIKKGIEKTETSRYIDIKFGFNSVPNVTTYIDGISDDANAHLFELEAQLNSLTDNQYETWGAKLFVVALKSFGDFIQFEYVSKYNYSLKQAKENNLQPSPPPGNMKLYKDAVDHKNQYGIMMTKDKIAFYHGVHTCCPGILGSYTTQNPNSKPINAFMREKYDDSYKKLVAKLKANNVFQDESDNDIQEKSHFALIFHGNLPTTGDHLRIRQSKNLDEMKLIINELRANQYREVILILSTYGDPSVYNKSHERNQLNTSLYECIVDENKCVYFDDNIDVNNIENNILEEKVQLFSNNLGTMRNFFSQSKSIINLISRLTIKNSLKSSLNNRDISVGLNALIEYKRHYYDISRKLKSKLRDFIIDFTQPKSLEEIFNIEEKIMQVINTTLEPKNYLRMNNNAQRKDDSIVPYSDITNKNLDEFKSKIKNYINEKFSNFGTDKGPSIKDVKLISDVVVKIRTLSKFAPLETIVKSLADITDSMNQIKILTSLTARQKNPKLLQELKGHQIKLTVDHQKIKLSTTTFVESTRLSDIDFMFDLKDDYYGTYVPPTYNTDVYNEINRVVNQRLEFLIAKHDEDELEVIFQEEKRKLIIELSYLYKKNLMYFTKDDVSKVKEKEKVLLTNVQLANIESSANIVPIINPYADKIIYKKFSDKKFMGKVDSVRMLKDNTTVYYHIQYEDGDHEELEKCQIDDKDVFNTFKTHENLCEITAWKMVQEGDMSKVKVEAKYRNDENTVQRDLFDILKEGGYEHVKSFMKTQNFKNTKPVDNLWRTGLKKFNKKLHKFITAEYQTSNTTNDPNFKPFYVVYSDTDSENLNELEIRKGEKILENKLLDTGQNKRENEIFKEVVQQKQQRTGGNKPKTIAQQSKRIDVKLAKHLKTKLKIKSKK